MGPKDERKSSKVVLSLGMKCGGKRTADGKMLGKLQG